MASFGLNIGSQETDICQLIIQSSCAFEIYFIAQLVSVGMSTKFVETPSETDIFAALSSIVRASALVTGSFGLNFLCQSMICPYAIPSSHAFAMYGIIQDHSEGMSTKLTVALTSVLIQRVFIETHKNSALVIGLLGLNVQSGYHLKIHLLAKSSMSSRANELAISLKVITQVQVVQVQVVQVQVGIVPGPGVAGTHGAHNLS